MAPLHTDKMRLNRLLVALGAATALIVAASVGAIIWVLAASSSSLDQTQRDGERRLIGSVIDTYRRTLAKNVADFTSWSELYLNFEGPRDAHWERDNLGPYIGSTFGMDRVFVVSRGGGTVYSYALHGSETLSHEDAATLARLAGRAFAAERADTQAAASGIVELHGVPMMAAASTIRTSALDKPSHFTLIELRELQGAFLRKLGRDYGIARLRIERSNVEGLGLAGPDGRPSAFAVAWTPSDAGRRHFFRALPSVAAVGVVMLAAFLGLAAALSRIVGAVRAGEARLARAELEATTARARAAEETSRSKSAFIANMSHELRTPLNAIIGFSEMILSRREAEVGPGKLHEYAKAIHDSGRHLLDIVNDILQVSRIEAGKYELALEPVDIAGAVRGSVQMMEAIARGRCVAIALDLEAGMGPAIADPRALQQILINVIGNAIKFSAENTSVEITAAIREAACEIAVVDRGCGIPEATLHSIGKPFVQAESAYSRKYQGTGLGLAISFLLADAMGATVGIESREGVGTSVRIRLCPAKRDHASLRIEAA